MKKMLLSTTAFLIFVSLLNAQPDKKTYFGIKGGFNHTVINGSEASGKKTGYTGSTVYGALFSEFRIGTSTYLNTELLFSWVNYWHFIEIPVHVRQMLTKNFGLFIGPKLDIDADQLDPKDDSQSGLFGVSAELGAIYNLSRRLFVEARYSIGLTKQFNDMWFDINDGRRNNLRAGIGFRF